MMEIQAWLQHRQEQLCHDRAGTDFLFHKTARNISPHFTFFKPEKKIHFATLIPNLRASSWDQFGRLNVNGMKILFLFKLFLKIKVWQQLARSRFPLHCLFVLEFIFSCNLRLRPAPSQSDLSPHLQQQIDRTLLRSALATNSSYSSEHLSSLLPN